MAHALFKISSFTWYLLNKISFSFEDEIGKTVMKMSLSIRHFEHNPFIVSWVDHQKSLGQRNTHNISGGCNTKLQNNKNKTIGDSYTEDAQPHNIPVVNKCINTLRSLTDK